jgi:hypothetical protein
MQIKKNQTSSWTAIIDFAMTPEYPNEFHPAYAHGDTIEELRVDLTRVMTGLKDAGRTPTRFVVQKKTVTTWDSDSQAFTELIE